MLLDELLEDHFLKNSVEFKREAMEIDRTRPVYGSEDIMPNIDELEFNPGIAYDTNYVHNNYSEDVDMTLGLGIDNDRQETDNLGTFQNQIPNHRGHILPGLSSSLPDKLKLLSLNLSSGSSKSPSPEFINYKEFHDERTINPRQLSLEKKRKKKTKHDLESLQDLLEMQPVESPPPHQTVMPNSLYQVPLQKDYILPSSFSSPNLKQYSDFKMNDECFNAIKIWLDNDNYNQILKNPTGVLPTNYKRRNSTNGVVSKPIDMLEKRKRRKSYNSRQDLKDLKLEISVNSAIDDSPDMMSQEFEESGSKTSSSNGVQSLTTSSNGDREEYREEIVSVIPAHNGRVLKNEPIVIPPQEDGKPFPCPNCSKQFKRSEHLKRHIRSVHSNIRPFHCKYCEKQFSRSDNLAQHLKTHYKINSNGTTSIIYGNPNLHNRGRRKSNFEDNSAGSDYDYLNT